MIDPITANAIAVTGKWVWDNYGSKFIELAAQKTSKKRKDHTLKIAWEKGTEEYLTKLYEQVNWLFILGKHEVIPLEQLYTEVHLFPNKLSAEQRYNLVEMEREFAPMMREQWRWREKERQDGVEIARQYQRLFIFGKPGAGKTTFLKHLALKTIKGEMGEYVPIFVSLKELSDSKKEIVPFIGTQFARCGLPEAEAFVQTLLEDGRGLVLFDGLDEVNLEGERRSQLIGQLNRFIEEFDECQLCMTCRLAATDYTFPRFTYAEMADFSPYQQEQFIAQWFQHDDSKRMQCWEALTASESVTLRELAQVPILLSLLCLIYEELNKFPNQRSDIYEEATRALLVKWDSKRSIERDKMYHDLTVRQRGQLLAQVAAETFEKGVYFIPQKDLVALIEAYLRTLPNIVEPDGEAILKAIADQHGLLVERARGIYSFSHLTLQEYFTALYIMQNEARGTLTPLMRHVGDARWREVFLLVAGILADAGEFTQRYLEQARGLIKDDKGIGQLLHWATIKSTTAQTVYTPFAQRIFYLCLALAHNFMHAGLFDYAYGIAITIHHDLASGLALTRDLALSFNIAIGSAIGIGLDHNLDPDRTLNRALDLEFSYDHSLALDYLITIYGYASQNLHKNTFDDMEQESFFTILHQGRAAVLAHSESLGLSPLKRKLEQLLLPQMGASLAEIHEFGQALLGIAIQERNIGHDWDLSEEQAELLTTYLEANQVLVDCLELATLPQSQRQQIETHLLEYP